MKYAQFCPVAKASEVVGERWMLLVIRELIAGASSFGELQRGLGSISPSVLSTRIKALLEHGIIERCEVRAYAGAGAGADKSRQYRLTQAGIELAPIIEAIGYWGGRWVRSRMTRDELDVELLMLHLARNFDAAAFPMRHAVVGFVFSDLHGTASRWWLLITEGKAELCAHFPGRAEDVVLTSKLRTLAQIFNGDIPLAAALAEGLLEADAPPRVMRSVQRWLRLSPFAATAQA